MNIPGRLVWQAGDGDSVLAALVGSCYHDGGIFTGNNEQSDARINIRSRRNEDLIGSGRAFQRDTTDSHDV